MTYVWDFRFGCMFIFVLPTLLNDRLLKMGKGGRSCKGLHVHNSGRVIMESP